jgi:hypothetical protein
MPINLVVALLALLGCLFLFAAIRRLQLRRMTGGFVAGTSALVLFALAVLILVIGADLKGWQRLTAEQPAGNLELSRVGAHQFSGILTYPSGESAVFYLRGDEWQVDARLLKWKAIANLAGFDTVYRLDRISGRYTALEDERNQPRTVYDLNPPQRIDLWDFIHRYHSWMPWMDALYGSATFLPMADKAQYAITVSQSGLVARPVNDAARNAVGSWH